MAKWQGDALLDPHSRDNKTGSIGMVPLNDRMGYCAGEEGQWVKGKETVFFVPAGGLEQ